MKLQYVLLAIISLSSTSALASKARLQALGQDANGSYYIQDTRNIFLNPATIVDTPAFVNFEWGSKTRPDTTNPNAEGGFTQAQDNLKYGVQLGRQTKLSDNLATVNNAASLTGVNAFLAPQDTIEVLAGSTTGDLKWGGSFIYQRSKEDLAAYPQRETSGYEIKGGVAKDDFQAFASLNLLNKADYDSSATVSNEFESPFGLTLGGAFALAAEQTLFAEFNWDKGEVNSNNNALDFDIDSKVLGLGYARVTELEEATTFFYSLGLNIATGKLENNVANTKNQTDSYSLPVVIGLENQTTSWMALRGSVTQNVLLSSSKTATRRDENNPNSTTVAAGAGFEFKKLTLDATFAGASTNGQLNATNFLANVGMTYLF